MRAFGLNCRSY